MSRQLLLAFRLPPPSTEPIAVESSSTARALRRVLELVRTPKRRQIGVQEPVEMLDELLISFVQLDHGVDQGMTGAGDYSRIHEACCLREPGVVLPQEARDVLQMVGHRDDVAGRRLFNRKEVEVQHSR